jgi:hypothetical protein
MAKKAPIKIPKLYPTQKIEIEGNTIEIRGYKPIDKPYVISIQHIQKQIRPIMKKVGELQSEIEEISRDEKGNQLSDKELKDLGVFDRIYEISDEIQDSTLEVEEITSKLVDGDSDTDKMDGPAYHLAQRGVKRFYYPNLSSGELDEMDDIDIGRYYASLIANTMISLANPPSSIERSIQARKRELEEADKGKQGKLKGKPTSPQKKK